MRIRSVLIASSLFCLFAAQGALAFEVTSVNLHLYLSGLKEARAPAVVEEHLVLSVSGPYRFVGAAFANEDWNSVHGLSDQSLRSLCPGHTAAVWRCERRQVPADTGWNMGG